MTEEQEMASVAWFDVKENDIFLEEFSLFIQATVKLDGSLINCMPTFTIINFDNACKKIYEDYITDILPYCRQKRFKLNVNFACLAI